MRGKLTFKIEGFDKPIVVQELTMKQILSLFQGTGIGEVNSWSDIVSYVKDQALPMVCDLTPDELLEFTPGEISQVYEKIREVNKVFFGLTRTPALQAVVEELKPKILAGFGDSFANLSNMDTLTPANMDTLISSMRSMKPSGEKPST